MKRMKRLLMRRLIILFVLPSLLMMTLIGGALLQPSSLADSDPYARRYPSVTFANLGTPPNGSVRYCSNCTQAAPCASGGMGAVANRINGAWDCGGGGGAAPVTSVATRIGDVTLTPTDVSLSNVDNTSDINKPVSLATAAALQTTSYARCLDAGANDTYACSLSPAIVAYTTGQVVWFKANTANTGAATLNLNAIGAKTIKKNKDADLADNDIKAGQWVAVAYDGTNFQLVSPYNTILLSQVSDITTTAAELNAFHGVKIYRALLSQTGTSAPTATVLENSLGGTVTYARTDFGLYTATLTGAFVVNKTAARLAVTDETAPVGCARANADTINISTSETDDRLNGNLFEIYVYP